MYLYHLSHRASALIEQEVAERLQADHVLGLDLILELAQSDQIERLDIITLNHDTLVEQLLTENKIPFVDGFGEQDGSVRWFDDALFDAADARVRIVKPHGSVNWYSFLIDGRERPAKLEGLDASGARDQDAKELEMRIRKGLD